MSSISVPLSTWRCQTKPAVGFFAKGVAPLGFLPHSYEAVAVSPKSAALCKWFRAHRPTQ